ncbi:MAG: prepilin-type N-terminal cleavage/methylation domain-containing protein [Caldiserica bacterium]|nr:prepilin-type N-terminal cleavage/methylation domain-containing protein [Caldisericota bacterium]
MGKINLLKKITGYRGVKKRAGFTLIEVVIAMAIILIIVVSVLLMVTFASASLKESEGKEMSKNIATYTVEYLRSRNVTYPDNPLGHVYSGDPLVSEFGNDDSHYFPGLVDLWNSPLKPNSTSDTINIHPALPDKNYDYDNHKAFYSSIKGYVSLADNPADSNPSLEDANAEASGGKYYDKQTDAPYVVRFPFNLSDPDAIKNFSALSGYNAKIYTTDENNVDTSKPEYDPHYTDTASEKAGTMAYRGFRVLTQIVARKKNASDPNHVQYYDVKVTVFWVTQGKEHSYSLATQIVTYGGG